MKYRIDLLTRWLITSLFSDNATVSASTIYQTHLLSISRVPFRERTDPGVLDASEIDAYFLERDIFHLHFEEFLAFVHTRKRQKSNSRSNPLAITESQFQKRYRKIEVRGHWADLGSLIYYRLARDVFDTSVGKIKAILLRVSPVVQVRKQPTTGNRRCLDTNMRALIEGSSTSVITGTFCKDQENKSSHGVWTLRKYYRFFRIFLPSGQVVR